MIPFNEYQTYTFDGGRLSHAYIARGASADRLAMAVVCASNGGRPCLVCSHCIKSQRGVHPDIITVKKADNMREITVDQIRGIKRDVVVTPNEAAKKAYIIENAELMNTNAQNALLRILEEPPMHVVFVLKTESPAGLLPTVLSRCVELKPSAADKISEKSETEAGLAAEFFKALSLGNAAIAEFMFRLESLDREKITHFIDDARALAVAEIRQAVSIGDELRRRAMSQAERTLAEAGEYLSLNVSSGHIAGLICAKLMTD